MKTVLKQTGGVCRRSLIFIIAQKKAKIKTGEDKINLRRINFSQT